MVVNSFLLSTRMAMGVLRFFTLHSKGARWDFVRPTFFSGTKILGFISLYSLVTIYDITLTFAAA